MTLRAFTAAALLAALAACSGDEAPSYAGPCPDGVDDGDPCTVDSCEVGVPAHVPLDPDDGNACTADACDPVAGVTHAPVDPDDGVACTADACDPASGVAHLPDPSACDAGEMCDVALGCVASPVVECMLDFPFVLPSPPATLAPGALTEITRADVWVAGVTEPDGPSALVLAEVGYGPAGSDPRAVAWTWATAGYGEQEPGRDEYHQRLVAPDAPGAYSYTFRFAILGGEWTYCDADGAIQGQDDFDPALLGEMTVGP